MHHIGRVVLIALLFVAILALGAIAWPSVSAWNDRLAAKISLKTIHLIYYLILFSISISAASCLYFHLYEPTKKRFVVTTSTTVLTVGATLAAVCAGPFQLEKASIQSAAFAKAKTAGPEALAAGELNASMSLGSEAYEARTIYVFIVIASGFFSVVYFACCVWDEGYDPISRRPRERPTVVG
jgi:hypothetical protein